MAYIAHGIIKCTPFLSVGHRDNTLFYGTISCLLIFLLNAVRLRLRLVLLYFAMFQCFVLFKTIYVGLRSRLIHRLYKRTNEGLRSFQYETYKSLGLRVDFHCRVIFTCARASNLPSQVK